MACATCRQDLSQPDAAKRQPLPEPVINKQDLLLWHVAFLILAQAPMAANVAHLHRRKPCLWAAGPGAAALRWPAGLPGQPGQHPGSCGAAPSAAQLPTEPAHTAHELKLFWRLTVRADARLHSMRVYSRLECCTFQCTCTALAAEPRVVCGAAVFATGLFRTLAQKWQWDLVYAEMLGTKACARQHLDPDAYSGLPHLQLAVAGPCSSPRRGQERQAVRLSLGCMLG